MRWKLRWAAFSQRAHLRCQLRGIKSILTPDSRFRTRCHGGKSASQKEANLHLNQQGKNRCPKRRLPLHRAHGWHTSTRTASDRTGITQRQTRVPGTTHPDVRTSLVCDFRIRRPPVRCDPGPFCRWCRCLQGPSASSVSSARYHGPLLLLGPNWAFALSCLGCSSPPTPKAKVRKRR